MSLEKQSIGENKNDWTMRAYTNTGNKVKRSRLVSRNEPERTMRKNVMHGVFLFDETGTALDDENEMNLRKCSLTLD